MQQSVDGLEQPVEGMQQPVKGLEQPVKGLEQSVKGLEQSVKGLEQSVEGLEQSESGKGPVNLDFPKESPYSLLLASRNLQNRPPNRQTTEIHPRPAPPDAFPVSISRPASAQLSIGARQINLNVVKSKLKGQI
jgi:hypothetical protein